MKSRLVIVQPVMTSYRYDYFQDLAREFDTTFYAGEGGSAGFGSYSDGLNVKSAEVYEMLSGKVLWQSGVMKALIKRPNAVFMNSNPRNIAMWLCLILSRFLRIPMIVHGQGLYHKANPGIITRFTYYLLISLCKRYICYTDYSRNSLEFLPRFLKEKLRVANNTLVNEYSTPPSAKDTGIKDILFLGRLRESNGLETLIEAVKIINLQASDEVSLHIVGGGEEEQGYRRRYESFNFIRFYGAIYDQKRIQEVSKGCLIGCYPGAAGLSVVHFMSLSLIPVVNEDMASHMGPEPSYIHHGANGIFFKEATAESIAEALNEVYSLDDSFSVLKSSYETYEKLSKPRWSSQVADIVREVSKGA